MVNFTLSEELSDRNNFVEQRVIRSMCSVHVMGIVLDVA